MASPAAARVVDGGLAECGDFVGGDRSAEAFEVEITEWRRFDAFLDGGEDSWSDHDLAALGLGAQRDARLVTGPSAP